MNQPKLVVLVGNIGCGKSTLSRAYAKQGFVVICRDDLRTMVGSGKYVFQKDIEIVIDHTVITMLIDLLQRKKDIVVDETNVDRKTRKRLIKLGKKYGYRILADVLPELSLEQCLENRQQDNLRGYKLDTWEEVWKKFNNRYQRPEFEEGFDTIFRRVENENHSVMW